VTAAFHNFHPAMVEGAVPACWSVVGPAELTRLRAAAAATALTGACPVDPLGRLTATLPLLRTAVAHCAGDGRVLTGANRELWPSLSAALTRGSVTSEVLGVAEVWQACTTLREHRGDGHVAALVAHGLNGLEAHLLSTGVRGTPAEVLRDNRGWSEERWDEGTRHLVDRGLLQAGGGATERGTALHGAVEAMTDALAEAAYAQLSDQEVGSLHGALAGCAGPLQASGLFPFPNPMGLPRL
jgi:hypothetical protein